VASRTAVVVLAMPWALKHAAQVIAGSREGEDWTFELIGSQAQFDGQREEADEVFRVVGNQVGADNFVRAFLD
jgi:hypothetical protein